MSATTPLPGWYQDPSGVWEGRYWDGLIWTNTVSRGGVTIDAPIEAERAALPPVPGSEMRTPVPVAATPSATVNTPNRSPLGAIFGVIAAVLAVVLIVVLVTNDSDSPTDDTPPATNPAETNPPATEAPVAPEPPDTTG